MRFYSARNSAQPFLQRPLFSQRGLGQRLLQEQHPERVVLGLREEGVAPPVAGDEVVDDDLTGGSVIVIRDLHTESGQTLQGSFSAVSESEVVRFSKGKKT